METSIFLLCLWALLLVGGLAAVRWRDERIPPWERDSSKADGERGIASALGIALGIHVAESSPEHLLLEFALAVTVFVGLATLVRSRGAARKTYWVSCCLDEIASTKA